MAAATNIFTDALMQHIVTKLNEITFSPVLTILTDFDMRRLPAMGNTPTSLFDFIIVEAGSVTNQLSSAVAINAYLQVYRYTIWYGRRGGETVDLTSLKITETNKIFEKMSDKIILPDLSPRAGAIVRSNTVTGVMYQNPANDALVRMNFQGTIVQVNLEIIMEVRRQVST